MVQDEKEFSLKESVMHAKAMLSVLKSLSDRIRSEHPANPDLIREFRELAIAARQPGEYDEIKMAISLLRQDVDIIMTELELRKK